MTRTPPSNVEGRELPMANRGFFALLFLGLPLIFLVGTLTLASHGDKGMLLGIDGLLLVMNVPLVAYVLSSRVILQDGALVQRSAFGTKRLELAQVRQADLRFVSTKGGRQERLTLTGPVTMRLGEQRQDWPTLRDAILAELPPGVRPARRA